MSLNQKGQFEDLITCNICKQFYDDPRRLSCSHTYCYKCMNKIATSNKNKFECPSNDGFKILKKEINLLPSDRTKCDLLELYGTVQNGNLCTNCKMVKAEYACDTCKQETFCSKCFKKEHVSRIMQKHKRLPINEKYQDLIPCQIHSRKRMECWCYECDTLICIQCLLDEHKDHRYSLIDDEVKQMKNKTNIHFTNIRSCLDYRISRTERLIHEIENESKSNRENLSKFTKSLRDIIEKYENDLLKQILSIEEQQKKPIEEYKSLLLNQVQIFNIKKLVFEMLVSSQNHTKLLQMKQEIEGYIDETYSIIKELQVPMKSEYYFEGLDQIDYVKSIIQERGKCVDALENTNMQLEQVFIQNRTKSAINLKGKDLSDSDMKVVNDFLVKTTTLTELSLDSNKIGQHGAEYIADALKMNSTLTTLYLKQNHIGPNGAQCIADSLKFNQVLTELSLYGNNIGPVGARYIADALKVNRKLAILSLAQNDLGPEGAGYISDSLKINETLMILYLYENKIGTKGAQYIADALLINKTLVNLSLYGNDIEEVGAQHISNALKTNQTLNILSLKQNHIGARGAQYIAAALRINHTLTTLILDENNFDKDDVQLINDAARINNTLIKLHVTKDREDEETTKQNIANRESPIIGHSRNENEEVDSDFSYVNPQLQGSFVSLSSTATQEFHPSYITDTHHTFSIVNFN